MNTDHKKIFWIIILVVFVIFPLFGPLRYVSSFSFFSFGIGKIIGLLIGIAFISQAKNSLYRGNIISAIILFSIGLSIAAGSFLSFFPIIGTLIRLSLLLILIYMILSWLVPKDKKNAFFSRFGKDHKDYYEDKFEEESFYKTGQKKYNKKEYSSKKAREFFGNDPDDPFSYKSSSSYGNFEDVEYEDWNESSDNKKKNKMNDGLDYSFSQNNEADFFNNENKNFQERNQKFNVNYKNSREYSNYKKNSESDNRYSVNLGSMKIYINKEDLKTQNQKIYVSCNLGEAKIIVDKDILTNIYGNVSMGEIKIGKQSFSGLNKVIQKKWIPRNPYHKTLELHCSVSFGEIKIRHK